MTNTKNTTELMFSRWYTEVRKQEYKNDSLKLCRAIWCHNVGVSQ